MKTPDGERGGGDAVSNEEWAQQIVGRWCATSGVSRYRSGLEALVAAALDAAEARGKTVKLTELERIDREARAEGERAGREATEQDAITFLNNLSREWEEVSRDAVTALAAAAKVIRLKGLRKETP